MIAHYGTAEAVDDRYRDLAFERAAWLVLGNSVAAREAAGEIGWLGRTGRAPTAQEMAEARNRQPARLRPDETGEAPDELLEDLDLRDPELLDEDETAEGT